jgi:ketosteroid isomerase-like protein
VSCGDAAQASAVLRDIIAADNARDLGRVMAYYTDDVVWAPPAPRPEMLGLSTIRESYVRMYGAFDPRLEASVETAITSGPRAVVTGRTRGVLVPRTADTPATQINDSYQAILRCEGEHWRVSRLSWQPAD